MATIQSMDERSAGLLNVPDRFRTTRCPSPVDGPSKSPPPLDKLHVGLSQRQGVTPSGTLCIRGPQILCVDRLPYVEISGVRFPSSCAVLLFPLHSHGLAPREPPSRLLPPSPALASTLLPSLHPSIALALCHSRVLWKLLSASQRISAIVIRPRILHSNPAIQKERQDPPREWQTCYW
jgi:hypothetical protein